MKLWLLETERQLCYLKSEAKGLRFSDPAQWDSCVMAELTLQGEALPLPSPILRKHLWQVSS